MCAQRLITVDGNEAVASVAYRSSDVIAIYPITPSSPMGELADEWAYQEKANLWGAVPCVRQMQSEGGAAGAVHGALQAGALGTTFTASQGLLLMIPNMYKIAGELNAFCMHVAARTIATHALSIFGDHSDVMACRQTGFGMLASGSAQEAQDFACIAQAASLRSRIPFLHFFDGFRTSHEIQKIAPLDDDDLRFMYDADAIASHRARALTPDRPVLRGTAQNPDTFFQAREACNLFYDACPDLVQESMDRFAERTGRRYRLFEYAGHPQAERVLVLMGSGAEVAHETVEHLVERGERVGVLKVRLYRPFDAAAFAAALPASTQAVAVLDRTKEPGGVGEPLYLDVVAALRETRGRDAAAGTEPRVVGGRYGLSSKEFTPTMVRSALDNLSQPRPKNHFTIGIVDDVTHTSLDFDPEWDIPRPGVSQTVFYGLGADGTVGACKNIIKAVGDETPRHVQGYFVYDSKKAGAVTVSHLRFGDRPLRSSYLIHGADFVVCNQFAFFERIDVLEAAAPGARLLINSSHPPEEIWDRLPREAQQQALEKRLSIHAVDAHRVAREAGLGGRIGTIMEACFYSLSGLLPLEKVLEQMRERVRKAYARKGEALVRRNLAALDRALEGLRPVPVPERATSERRRPPAVAAAAPEFVQRVTATMMAGKGDLLPVSAFPVDGTWPVGTSRWEKRGVARDIPVWDPAICIQCNKCAFVCPHAAIRAKVYAPAAADGAPAAFKSTPYRGHEFEGSSYTIQVAPDDCTGCRLCVTVCPAKDRSNPRHKAIDMAPLPPLCEAERANYSFFLDLPEADREHVRLDNKGSQFLEPLFEYSGACAGCGETPYLKLLTQLMGDRLLIANATGCSSIYGGNLPTTPYTVNREGRGPAWSNSLFEDNAEFGYGFRLALDAAAAQARTLLKRLEPQVGGVLAEAILQADQAGEAGIQRQRNRVAELRRVLAGLKGEEARRLEALVDYLVKKSVWLVGGDGWAYDIGYAGLDHVLSTNADVNILILDTEVYSNTGGQQSKATPLGAAAKFATGGKLVPKKDIGMMAMQYGHIYVARIAFGASDNQTVRALMEADSYPGPSMVIAYSHCIAHGYDLSLGAQQQKLAVDSGAWPLYRFDPRRMQEGQPPFVLDSGTPKVPLEIYRRNEARFRIVEKQDPLRFRSLLSAAQRVAAQRVAVYHHLAHMSVAEYAGAAPEPQAAPRR